MANRDSDISIPTNGALDTTGRAGTLAPDPAETSGRTGPASDEEADHRDAKNSLRNLSDEQPQDDAPAPAPETNGMHDGSVENESYESELPELDDGPPPPDEQQPTSPPQPAPDCTHLSWCDCPTRSSYATGHRFPHLSERALDQMRFPESHERSKGKEHAEGEATLRRRLQKAQFWDDKIVTLLTRIAYADPDKFRATARQFVDRVNFHYPPAEWKIGEPATVIERVGQALEEWMRDMDYDRLAQRVRELVEDRKDVMFLFQDCLPLRFGRVTVAEANEAFDRDSGMLHWAGAEELEKARKALL